MKKAVFVDYTGTLVKEDGPEMRGVVRTICENSSEKDPRRALAFWWRRLKQYEAASFGDAFLTQDEIVQRLLEDCAPLFEDVPAFFAACPVPVWVLTNNGARYVRENLRAHGLAPAGIVAGDMARAYKPHRALFEKALALSECLPDEVLHIGDSVNSDIEGARGAGLDAVLVLRGTGEVPQGVRAVRSLPEALALLA